MIHGGVVDENCCAEPTRDPVQPDGYRGWKPKAQDRDQMACKRNSSSANTSTAPVDFLLVIDNFWLDVDTIRQVVILAPLVSAWPMRA